MEKKPGYVWSDVTGEWLPTDDSKDNTAAHVQSSPEKIPFMPTRKDIEVIPGDESVKDLKLGWIVRELNHGDPYPEPTGKMHDTDYIGKYDIPKGYTSIDVLTFLWGKPYDNLAWNWIVALRPSAVRVSRDGFVTLDCYTDRVTVFVDENNIIKRMYQEVSVGLIGVHHGHDLSMATNDPNYKQQTHVNSIFINSKGVKKLFVDGC